MAVKLLTYTGVSGSLEDNDEFVAQGMNVLLKGLEQVGKAATAMCLTAIHRVLCLWPS